MKKLIIGLLLTLTISAQAWPEGNWRYEATGYDELRQKQGLLAVNQPVSPSLDGWVDGEVLLAFANDPKFGFMIWLKSNSSDFECPEICNIEYRFDNEPLQSVNFLNFPNSPKMLMLVAEDAMNLSKQFKRRDTLILEVKRKYKDTEQFKYRLEGFLQPTK